MRTEKKQKERKRMSSREDKDSSWLYFLPLLFILAVVPLIVHLKMEPLTGDRYLFWNGVKENPDFFSYYKAIWLMISTLVATVVFAYILNKSNYRILKTSLWGYYATAGLYLLFVILSASLSKYNEVALWGFTDRYEGMFVLLSYIMIWFITLNQVQSEKQVKVLLMALYAGATIIGLIGLFQYLGYDLWKTDFGKSLLLPSAYASAAAGLEFRFGENFIYSTLYHPNYVGSYTAMLFPLSFTLFLLSKDMLLRIAMGLMTVLMGVTWLGSNSRAGMIGVGVAMLVLLIVINRFIIKYWKVFLVGLAAVVVIFLGFNQLSKGYMGNQLTKLLADATAIFSTAPATDKAAAQEAPLRGITVDGPNASITMNTEKLNFNFDKDLFFTTNEGQKIEYSYYQNDGKIVLQDPIYKDYNLKAGMNNKQLMLEVVKGNMRLLFELKPGNITLVDNKGQTIDAKPVATWGFEGKEKLGSSRGYIWSRTIPLLKNTIVTGYGPDTFAIVFPQNDLVGKMYAYDGDLWQLVDKPHNLYLQIALSTGILSLLGFLALLGLYSIQSLRLYFTSTFPDFLSQAGVGLFVAIMGYLGAAFFNDSIVSVAPVFWILLGLGMAINHLLKMNQKMSNEGK